MRAGHQTKLFNSNSVLCRPGFYALPWGFNLLCHCRDLMCNDAQMHMMLTSVDQFGAGEQFRVWGEIHTLFACLALSSAEFVASISSTFHNS